MNIKYLGIINENDEKMKSTAGKNDTLLRHR